MSNSQKIEKEISKKEHKDEELIIKWISEIKNESTRTKAIENLTKFREKNNNLSIYLWYSRGTIAILLQEIISTYQYLSSSKLSLERSNKICAVINLFDCIASQNKTRNEFLESQIPIFLYPFLNNTNKTKHYEYLKLTSLNVIGTLVKSNDPKIISFLINTQITPLLLKIMEKGSELSRTMACCIVYKVVQDDYGIKYICEKKERYNGIIQFMRVMMKNKFSQRLIKYILKTFLRLSDNKDARYILKNEVLKDIKNESFVRCLDDSSKNLVNILLKILNEKDKTEEIKELKKDLTNNSVQNMNILNNNHINNTKNNINQQLNMNNGDMINQNNITANMLLVNQINQLKMQQRFMISPNFGDINYNMYNGNDNYMNKINCMNNQNPNKGFGNMNFYGIYKNN